MNIYDTITIIVSVAAFMWSICQFRRQVNLTRAIDIEKSRVRLSVSFVKNINKAIYTSKDVIISENVSNSGYNKLINIKKGNEKDVTLIRIENVSNNNLYNVHIRVNNDIFYQYPVLRANHIIIFEVKIKEFSSVVLRGSTFADEIMFIEIKTDNENEDGKLLMPQYYFMKNSNSMVKYPWGEKLDFSSKKYELLNNNFNEIANTIWISIGKENE